MTKKIVVPDCLKEYALAHRQNFESIMSISDIYQLINGDAQVYNELYTIYPHQRAKELSRLVGVCKTDSVADDEVVTRLIETQQTHNQYHLDLESNSLILLNVCDAVCERYADSQQSTVVNKPTSNVLRSKFHVYNTIKDEVQAAFNHIVELLNNGVKPEMINIIYTKSVYQGWISYFATMHHIDIDFGYRLTIAQHPDFKLFQECETIEQLVDKLEQHQDKDIVPALIGLVNSSSNLNDDQRLTYIFKEAKNTNIVNESIVGAIDAKSFSQCQVVEYSIILGCDKFNFPAQINTNIINDNQASKLGLNTITQLNEQHRLTAQLIAQMPNVYFSQSTTDGERQLPINDFFVNTEEFDMKVEQCLFGPTGVVDIDAIIAGEADITQYNPESIDVSLDDDLDLSLSFSSIKTYFNSPYEFYKKYILYLKKTKMPNFYFGTLVHAILQAAIETYNRETKQFNVKLEDLIDDCISTNDVVYPNLAHKWLTYNWQRLNDWICEVYQDNDISIQTEQKYELKSPDSFNVESRIDLIISDNNTFNIIDYKVKKYNSIGFDSKNEWLDKLKNIDDTDVLKHISNSNEVNRLQNFLSLYILKKNQVYCDQGLGVSTLIFIDPHSFEFNDLFDLSKLCLSERKKKYKPYRCCGFYQIKDDNNVGKALRSGDSETIIKFVEKLLQQLTLAIKSGHFAIAALIK